jgi:AcrR family transcriptional regulator
MPNRAANDRILRTPPDRQRQRKLKRADVLAVAVKAFNERGFHNTSLDELADALNVTKPALYRYFRSKDELLLECVRLGLQELNAAYEDAARQPVNGRQKVISVAKRYIDVVTTDFGACLVRVAESAMSAQSRAKFRRAKALIDRQLRALIEEGIADGSIASCDATMIGFAIAGAMNWIGQWYTPDGPKSAERIAEDFSRFFDAGLAPRGE